MTEEKIIFLLEILKLSEEETDKMIATSDKETLEKFTKALLVSIKSLQEQNQKQRDKIWEQENTLRKILREARDSL